MKNLIYLSIFFAFVSSCAIQAPMLMQYYSPIGENDNDYQSYCKMIDLSKINDANKAIARSLVKSQFDFRKSIIKFSITNDSVLKVNNKKNNRYTVANNWIGGLGGLSSIATIWVSWTVVIPIVSGVWNIFGLSIQKQNINPELEQSNKNKDEIASINEKFLDSKDKFLIMIGSLNKNDANSNFEIWKTKINSAINDASILFGVFNNL